MLQRRALKVLLKTNSSKRLYSVESEPAHAQRIATAPDFHPPDAHEQHVLLRDDHVQRIRDFIVDKDVLFLTGAGISTESGLPDYRSPRGSYSRGHKPITFQEFMGSQYHRQRYWARSFTAFHLFSGTKPNAAHEALSRLERHIQTKYHRSLNIITQNVDGLHQQAGSSNVLELHGHLRSVRCMTCGVQVRRKDFQARLEEVNRPWLDTIKKAHATNAIPTRADGDVDLGSSRYEDFEVCTCDKCGGIMKPTVVFFGENIDPDTAKRSFELAEQADCIIVAGSSLQVFSAYRLIRKAVERGTPYGIINIGPTRADEHSAFKFQDRLGQILPEVIKNL